MTKPTMIDQKEIEQTIFKELGIANLPSDARERILVKLSENILKRITLVILDNLPEEARPRFDALSKEGDQQKLQEFLKAQISNLDELVQNTIKKTLDKYKSLAEAK